MKTILYNGNIITMDKLKPKAQAVSMENGRFTGVGSNQEILSLADKDTVKIDLEGKMFVPGFIDSHMHLVSYGYSLQMADLGSTNSINHLTIKTKEFMEEKKLESGQWVLGRGWNHELFHESRFPNRYDLDQISTEYPICLTRACCHVSVVNSKALEIARVNKDTPQVEGGHFDVDDAGEPLGIFRENALQFIYDHIPQVKEEDIKGMILDASNNAIKQGITSIHTDDFGALPGVDFHQIIKAYTELAEQDQLPVRIYEQCLLQQIGRLKEFLEAGYRTGQGDDFFKIGPLKLLGDGSLGARTASLLEPYADDPSTKGIPVFTQQELDDLVTTAHDAGMQVAIHAIGDQMMYTAFISIEKAQNLNPRADARHGIVHCQITDRVLLDRFKALGAIAYIQPIFVSTDWQVAPKRIGKERIQTSYNWKSLLDRGVHLACGSDCPVEPFDVLPGIYAAVTRKDLQCNPENGWMPSQKLTIDEALYGFTMEGAYASFEENIKGSISVGKLADAVVLSHDLYKISENEIKDVKVEMTFVGGKLYKI